jgi:hypothetical protein
VPELDAVVAMATSKLVTRIHCEPLESHLLAMLNDDWSQANAPGK